MHHSEWFQASLDIKASLTHSFNPETKPTALGKDYFCSTSVSALAPSSCRGKTWLFALSSSQVIPPPSAHTASSPSRTTPGCFHSPRHRTSSLPLTAPTLALLAQTWAEARPGWWSQHRGLLLVNLLPGWFIYLQGSVVAGVGKGAPWRHRWGLCQPAVLGGQPVLQPTSLVSSKVPQLLKHVGSFKIIVVLKLPLLNKQLFLCILESKI